MLGNRLVVHVILLVVLVFTTSNCGFRLHGSQPFPQQWEPLEVVSIEGYDDISQAIGITLNQRDITQYNQRQGTMPLSRLRIMNEKKTIQDITVGDSKTRQFTLEWMYRFDTYDLTTKKWNRLITKGFVSASEIVDDDDLIEDSANRIDYDDVLRSIRMNMARNLIRSLSRK